MRGLLYIVSILFMHVNVMYVQMLKLCDSGNPPLANQKIGFLLSCSLVNSAMTSSH